MHKFYVYMGFIANFIAVKLSAEIYFYSKKFV